jgi:predicted DNA-binding transcriptional regulator YafY
MNNGSFPTLKMRLRTKLREAFLRWCCLRPKHVSVVISYSDKKDDVTRRTIRPLRIERKKRHCACGRKLFVGPVKCIAWCELRQAERAFFASQMRIHSWRID